MYYQVSIDTPANTSEAVPLITPLAVTRGVIRRVVIGFPPGAVGLLRVRIFDKSWQILPINLNDSLGWDNYTYDIALNYPLEVEPYVLTVCTWNLDDSYQHSIFVGVVVDESGLDTANLIQQYPISE
jgi:hypothetical protein